MKRHQTLIVVADGANARFFLHEGPGAGIRALTAHDRAEAHPASRDLGTDRPGRVHESATSGRSAMEAPDPHDQAEVAFATRLAASLPAIMAAEKADRLVLAADPRALGRLRAALPAPAAGALAATLDKNLVKLPAKELARHLEDVLAM